MNFIPDIPPKIFSFSAVIVGYLLIDDTTANEQNALGNWLKLVAQVLCTNAYYQQVQQERGNGFHNNTINEPSVKETIILLEKMINAIQQEMNNLKNKNH